VAADEDVLQRQILAGEQAPSSLGRRQIKLARALHLLRVELTSVGDDLRGAPCPLGRAHQDEVWNEVSLDDPRGDLVRFDVAAPRQRALEILRTAVEGLRLAMPQQGQSARTHRRPSSILVWYTRTGS
jgi:hypothetical protein